MVTIRLTRRGGRNSPFYHIVVTDSRKRQGGTVLEQVGYFNPVARGKDKKLEIKLTRIAHWTGKGATMSDRVRTLVSSARKQAAA
jgi:small subunit ribosomal protein S16